MTLQYFLFCREKRGATRLDLLPWICTGLRTLEDSKSFLPFEVVMEASHGMLEHYKERLAYTETQIQLEWSQKGVLYLVRSAVNRDILDYVWKSLAYENRRLSHFFHSFIS